MNQAELLERIKHVARTKETVLDLSGENLTALPAELWQLTNLTALDLSDNQLGQLPVELGQLTNLTALHLNNNRLSHVPIKLGQLTKLTVLHLQNNQLGRLPYKVWQLTNLTTLDLSDNQLSQLPAELGQLTNLTTLYLNNNQLSQLPAELGQLTNLTTLYLNNNQLSQLPAELEQLTNLIELDISDNQLILVPSEIWRLTNLTTLYLHNNRLSQLPAELGRMTKLTTLYLNSNRLSQLPAELGQLTNLTGLYLRNNQLSQLPTELRQLTKLVTLDLSNNQVRELPTELTHLTDLTMLNLSVNPITFPPPGIVEQGITAILVYLRAQSTSTRQWVSKLLVVGQGQVGKTELLQGLQGNPFNPQQNTTHGIEIRSLEFIHPTETNVHMTLNTWDFGGQDIYHATHQFFLTNRSLFLIVWSVRSGWEVCKLMYWLKAVHANAPDSPILLVATHVEDGRNADLPLSELQQQFPQIVGQCEISNRDRRGFEQLRMVVTNTAAKLPLMGEQWPVTWLNFANTLRKSKQRHITPQRFWQVMTNHEVEPDGQRVLATWLHELGEILFFQYNDELNDIVIFKPQWVTEHISRVLEAEEITQRNGIFTRACMERLWYDLEAPMRDHFLRLMERFNLSYRTLENKDISLVVERLPFEPPDYEALWQGKQQEPNCKEISMKFQLSEVLPGIPTWFIARQHRFTIEEGERRGIHWRTGVLFQDREQTHLALAKIGRDNKTNAEYGVLCITPRKGIFQNEMRESHTKKGFAFFLSSSDDGMSKELHTRYSACLIRSQALRERLFETWIETC